MRNFTFGLVVGRIAARFGVLLLALAACQPDQVEHLKDSKRIGIETANWEVKRIMPADLLHATRWAGDSLTATADTLLRRTLARELAAGGVARAAAFCRPEAYKTVDSLAKVLQASARRIPAPPGTPADTVRNIQRPRQEAFAYERAIVLNSALCLRCHGSTVSAADFKLINQQPPRKRLTGYALGQRLGTWQVAFKREGVAEFYTMKTRKKWKPHKF